MPRADNCGLRCAHSPPNSSVLPCGLTGHAGFSGAGPAGAVPKPDDIRAAVRMMNLQSSLPAKPIDRGKHLIPGAVRQESIELLQQHRSMKRYSFHHSERQRFAFRHALSFFGRSAEPLKPTHGYVRRGRRVLQKNSWKRAVLRRGRLLSVGSENKGERTGKPGTMWEVSSRSHVLDSGDSRSLQCCYASGFAPVRTGVTPHPPTCQIPYLRARGCHRRPEAFQDLYGS